MTTNAVERASSRLSEQTLLEMFWIMLLSRRLDERAWALHRQGKIAFHISAMGHEGAQVGAAFAINRGIDYFCPYYRDLALSLAIGVTPTDFMFSLFGKKDKEGDSEWLDMGVLPPDTYTLEVESLDENNAKIVNKAERVLREGEQARWEVSMKELLRKD